MKARGGAKRRRHLLAMDASSMSVLCVHTCFVLFFFVIRGDGNKSQLLLRRPCIHQPWVLLDEKTLLTPLTFCRGVTSSLRRPGRACGTDKYLDELHHSRDEYSRI